MEGRPTIPTLRHSTKRPLHHRVHNPKAKTWSSDRRVRVGAISKSILYVEGGKILPATLASTTPAINAVHTTTNHQHALFQIYGQHRANKKGTCAYDTSTTRV